MGLAPLPEPPISYKAHKPALPKPKSIFKTKETKKPPYPGEHSKTDSSMAKTSGFFITQDDTGEGDIKDGEEVLSGIEGLQMASKFLNPRTQSLVAGIQVAM